MQEWHTRTLREAVRVVEEMQELTLTLTLCPTLTLTLQVRIVEEMQEFSPDFILQVRGRG